MASDRQVTFDGNPPLKGNYGPKIRRLFIGKQEVLLATCGNVDSGIFLEEAFRKAVEAGETRLDADEKKLKKATGLVYYRSGVIHVYDGSVVPITLNEPFFGIGSGSSYAIGALYHGASLKEAIRIACLCDPYSGMGIQYEQFKGNTGKNGNNKAGGKGNRNV